MVDPFNIPYIMISEIMGDIDEVVVLLNEKVNESIYGSNEN